MRIERQPPVLSAAAMITFGLINFLWVLVFAKGSFISQKFHKTSTWFSMWLVIAVLGVVFSRAESFGHTGSGQLDIAANRLINMFPVMYGGMIFGYREKKKGFLRLMGILAVKSASGTFVWRRHLHGPFGSCPYDSFDNRNKKRLGMERKERNF